MKRQWTHGCSVALLTSLLAANARASLDTIGENGINSVNLGLTGAGISIGQVEFKRPGDPDINDNSTPFEPGIDDDGLHSNSTTDPKAVFIEDGGAPTPNSNAQIIDNLGPPIFSHATEVAGVMISGDAQAKGVAPDADLYASAVVGSDNLFDRVALSAQHIALQDSGDVRAINFSFLVPFEPNDSFDGNSQVTQFVDWSASVHDVLYVQAGDEGQTFLGVAQPADNFNGIKVGASAKPLGDSVYRQVSDLNRYNQHPDSDRTLIDIIAPGENVEVAAVGGPAPPMRPGTSYAAPHVTGTVALLQEHADAQIPSAGWDADARRHEVMKAVLMNSADKIEEGSDPPPDGLAVPAGGYLGMERTVLKQDGVSTWFQSDAYPDLPLGQGQFTPLDDEMGTGHLNANRAFTQFSAGEHDYEDGDIPVIGWDYGTTTGMNPITGQRDNNRYRFEEPLLAGSFVSITIAWDRDVDLDIDAGTANQFDAGDSFEDYDQESFEPEADSVINDLDLHFMPKLSGSTGDAEASSVAKFGTVDHIFFQVPSTGEWEFWVEQWDEEAEVGVSQNYAVAWWAMSAADAALGGDFNGDGMVDGADLAQWRGDFGPTDDGSDADGDGDSDGADFLTWQQNLGSGVPAVPANAAVPEPSAWLLAVVGLPLLLRRRAG